MSSALTPEGRLRRTFGKARRRVAWGGFAKTMLVLSAVLSATVLALLWLPLELPPAWRKFAALAALAAGGATALLIATRYTAMTLRHLGRQGLWRYLEAPKAGILDIVRTGSDLACWEPDGPAHRGVSAELARAQIRSAAEVARDVGTKSPFAHGELMPWLLALAGFCALAGAVLVARPDALERSISALLEPPGVPPLQIGDLTVAIAPPAYTGLPETVLEGAGGDLSVYRGSRIRLSGRLSDEADAGLLRTPAGTAIALQPADRRFEAAWIVDQAGTYSLSFQRDGRPLPVDFPPRAVLLTEDRRPVVKLEAPTADLEIFGGEDLPVRFSASDDFAVKKAAIVLSGDQEVRVPVALRPASSVTGDTVILPLSWPELGAGAYLHVEATDGDTVSGPKTAASRSVYLAFSSREGLLSDIEAMQERLFEQLLGHLADHLELADTPPPNPDRARKNAGDLVTLLDALVAAVSRDELAADAPAALAVLAMRSSLNSLLRPFIDGGPSGPLIVRELERDVLLIDRLLRNLRMEKAMALGDELEDLEKAFFDRLAEGAEPSALLPLLRRIQEMMARMTAMMTQQSGSMPESFVNSDALRNMPRSELEQTLQALEKAIRDGDREAASKLAEKLLEQMNTWMAALEEAAENAANQALGAMAGDLDALLSDLKNIIEKQEQIFDKTNFLNKPDQSETTRRTPEEARDLAGRIEKHLQAITGNTRRMEALAPYRKLHGGSSAARTGRTRFMEARARMNAAVNEIRRRYRSDLNAARDALGALDEGFEDFSAELDRTLSGDVNREKSVPLAQATRGEIAALREEFDRLLSPAEAPLTPQTQKKLGQLGKKQESNASKTGDFSEKLGEALRNLPLLPPDIGEKAGEAGQAMERSAQELGRSRPGGSVPHQTEALERLSEVSGELQSARRKLRQGMSSGNGLQMVRGPGRGPGQGREIDRSRVEIPRETEARELRGFREDVLKAMRSGPYPREYESDVESYYEGLIK